MDLSPWLPMIPLMERPKSVSLMKPSLSIRTFSGFKLTFRGKNLLSIYDIFKMQMLQSKDHLGGIKLRPRMFKNLDTNPLSENYD